MTSLPSVFARPSISPYRRTSRLFCTLNCCHGNRHIPRTCESNVPCRSDRRTSDNPAAQNSIPCCSILNRAVAYNNNDLNYGSLSRKKISNFYKFQLSTHKHFRKYQSILIFRVRNNFKLVVMFVSLKNL